MKHKLFYVVIVCILISMFAGCSKPQYADLYGISSKTHSAVTPVGSDTEWWIPRHENVLKRISDGNVDLIFVGDSITHGWEWNAKELWDKYYAPRNAVNMGFSADRTEHVLWRFDHGEIDGISPKLAVLLIGVNNPNPPEETADGIKSICAKMRTTLPKTKILMLAIFPCGAGPSPWRTKNAKTSELASAIADNDMIYYMDIKEHFLDNNGTLSRGMTSDLLHPNLEGYKIWAEAIEDTVAELMGEK